MTNKLLKIIEDEQQRYKFLAHDICAHGSGKRLDSAICDSLLKGEQIKYQLPIFAKKSYELAMSLWSWNYDFHSGWGLEKTHNRQGIIIFDDKLYDKICPQE